MSYKLVLLPENCDTPKYLRSAVFRFLVTTAYINLYENKPINPNQKLIEKLTKIDNASISNSEKCHAMVIKELSKFDNGEKDKSDLCFSMLIHNSGQTKIHKKDQDTVIKIIDTLKDKNKFLNYVKEIYAIARKHGEDKAEKITRYITENINKSSTLVINSREDRDNLNKVSNPEVLFTIAIGGNIISRGVTFNNLLSMYFTRSVAKKSKLQQDTYIQRARMFGPRGNYLEHFELTIPKQLYFDWHRCFVYNKLALDYVKKGNTPIYLEDRRIRPIANRSIDKTTVHISSGEMSLIFFIDLK